MLGHPKRAAGWALVCWGLVQGGAHAMERVMPDDAMRDCAGIQAEMGEMDKLIQAGSTERTLGTAAAGAATNVGTQVVTSQVASGLFGSLGGLAARLAGATAQATVESKMTATPEAQAAAAQAKQRHAFLTQLQKAKACEAGGSGRALSPEEFQQVAAAGAPLQVTALSRESVGNALGTPIETLPTQGVVNGKVDFRGKTVHLTEFRVLFEVAGEVTASTRGGYLLGTDYGSTRATVIYKVPQVDIAAFQAITDRAFEDFKARASAAGVQLVYSVPEGGGVYVASEPASTPAQPVFLDKSLGYSKRKFLVMAPTGMMLVPRGFAGIGAGNISRRIEWGGSNREGISITQTVSIAELESSGGGSTIFKRTSSAEASSQLTVGNSPEDFLVQSHVSGGLLRIGESVRVPGNFANFRTVSTFDSNTDATSRAIGTLQNLMGQGANMTKKVEKAVELDGPATARLSLQGLATVNQAVVEALRAGL